MIYTVIYHILISAGAISSFIAWRKGHKRYLILSILLFITTSMELYIQFLIRKNVDFTFLYHAFVAIEYPVFCWFLLDGIRPGKIKNIVKTTIPLFIIASLIISNRYYHFKEFPGFNIELEGLFQSILCTYILFNLEVKEDQPVIKNQYFWICSGILIFYGTMFFFNGVYTKILNINSDKAMELYVIINTPLNIVMYAFILIGILCLLTTRRPSIQ